jgi:hypothetical protein
MVAAWQILEWAFVAVVGGLTVLAGLFGLYMLLQSFRNSGLRRRSRRPTG